MAGNSKWKRYGCFLPIVNWPVFISSAQVWPKLYTRSGFATVRKSKKKRGTFWLIVPWTWQVYPWHRYSQALYPCAWYILFKLRQNSWTKRQKAVKLKMKLKIGTKARYPELLEWSLNFTLHGRIKPFPCNLFPVIKEWINMYFKCCLVKQNKANLPLPC